MGKSNTPTLTLSPVMGIISLTTTAPASGTLYIKSIELESVGDEKLSGAFTTSSDYAGITGGTTSSITISPASGTKPFGTVFTFAVPAQEYASGLRFRITAVPNANGTGAEQVMVFAKQSAFEVASSTLYPLTAPAFKESVISTPTVETINSSTLGVTWSGANAANNQKKTWKIYVYSDSGCNSLVRTVDIAADLNVWTDNMGSDLRFAIGGLSQNTTYYVKVEDVQSGIVSAAGNAKTDAFTVVPMTSIATSTTGVVFAEDFSELAWGGVKYNGKDYAGCSPGPNETSAQTLTFAPYLASSPSHITNWTTLNYKSPESGEWSFRNAKLDTAIPASRLSDWYSESNCIAKCGYLKLGGLGQRGYAITPAFTVAEGYMAKVKVTISAAKYDADTENHSIAVVHQLIKSGWTPSERNQSNFVWVAKPDPAQYIEQNASGTAWDDIVVENLYLTNGDRIEFGSRNGSSADNYQRILMNSIKVEVVAVVPEADYLISCYERLKAFMDAVGTSSGSGSKSVKGLVTHNITLTAAQQTALASSYPLAGYTGTLRGQDHTITGLTQPFFADLKGNVEHLTLNSTINATTDSFGDGPAIVAEKLSDGGSLSYCTSRGSVTFQPSTAVSSTRYVAGLVGYVLEGSVTHCTNEASISFPHNSETNEMNVAVGGVVAKIDHASGSCSDLSNSGCVSVGIQASSETTKWLSVGGVVGELCNVDGEAPSLLTNTNTGAVSLSGAATGEVCLGGVIGYSDRSVSQCSNSGSVSYTGSSSGTLLVGGVVGNSAGSNKTIQSTVNGGAIVINSETSVKVAHIGGLSGKTKGAVNTNSANGSGGTITITSLTVSGDADYNGGYAAFIGGVVGEARAAVSANNAGNIAVNGLSASNRVSVGGVVGTNQDAVVTGTNSGNVVVSAGSGFSNNFFLGGVVGHGKGNITGSTNEGQVSNAAPVTTESKYLQVGGIVGYNNGSSAVSNCTNSGYVTNSGTSKGYIYVGGITSETDANITSCYNTGVVSNSGEALTQKADKKIYHVEVAGVAGHNNGKTIRSCYNTEAVSNTGDSGAGIFVGGVCGQSAAGTFVTCYNTGSVSNSGFAYDSAMYNDVAIGGLVGYLNGTVTLTGTASDYNYNNGPVEETSTTQYVGVGGVVGHINGSGSNLTYTKNLANGDIEFAHNSRTRSFVGGVVGCAQTLFTMNDASNAGNLDFEDLTIIGRADDNSPDNGSIFIGGVFGGFTKKSVGDAAATFSRLSNSGRIACWNPDSSNSDTNGYNMKANSSNDCNRMSIIAGVAAVGWVNNKTFTDCTNSGRIAIYNAIKTVVGGVIGYTNVNPSGCVNTGAISYCRYNPALSDNEQLGGNGEVGGVVGDVEDVTVLSNLKNDANVRSTGSSPNCFTGGIAGWVHDNMTGFNNCKVGTTTDDGSNHDTISGAKENEFGSTAAGLFAASGSAHAWDFVGCQIKKGTKCQAVSFSSTSDANFQKALIGRNNPTNVTNPPSFVTSF
jgi:hypothetical protein